MQILALNSSPRDNQTSKTELILQKFLAGTRQAGATTETIYLRDHRIEHCLGCFSCWTNTPGRCIQDDDMTNELIDRFLAADLVVLATPLYFGNINARLKVFLERTLPIYDPAKFDFSQGSDEPKAILPLRFERHPRIVALSVCGFPDPESFKLLCPTMQMIYGSYLVAEIYRDSSEFMDVPQFQPQMEQVLAATVRAGVEVVQQGRVGENTMANLTQPLAPAAELIAIMQQTWPQ
ncbi:MAG: flavodoxin family protein [Desulfobacca sp.]|nr:flavodoxin family protein [Desulfobacca sp.]